MRAKSKRLFNVWALVLATMVVISGCANGGSSENANSGGSGSSEGSGEPVTITYSQWGTAEELHRTQELLDQFMKANTDIKVKLEGKDSGSYWDGLTANAAGVHFRTCSKRVMHTWRNTPNWVFSRNWMACWQKISLI
ncbi:hypothetical protein P9222_32360 [Paenibacillus amylolyticus]|nr:hypothetical protein [Paenibacillus amylolyticus]WFR62754.1 hypothetical protein P9222_32360 [Paenibacillus amylolyticus]